LPPQSWAYNGEVSYYNFDPARARQILDTAGYPAKDGVRFHLTMKTSTEESSRLMAAIFQQQLRDVGIVLDIRSFESATFFADVLRGEFQVYSLRWIGGNQDPDIFDFIFSSDRFPPQGANRGFYSNPRVDALINQARRELDQEKRKQLYAELQQILAQDVPYVNLWYFDNVLVHSRRLQNFVLTPSGSYDFLRTVSLRQ
jgi:peptide/nickel transport system substrate-binding protein